MSDDLSGLRVAILAENGFEQAELTEPRMALEGVHARTYVVSPQSGSIRGWNHTEWGEQVPVNIQLDQTSPGDFDALLLPGGVMNPDKLRMNPKAVQFVKGFVDAGKPIAAICHAPWTLVEAGVVRGRTLTSWPSLRTDIQNAGGEWVDQEAVRDGRLVTSRKPADIPAFNREMIRLFAEARSGQKTRTAS